MKNNMRKKWYTVRNVTELMMQVVHFTGLVQVCRQVAFLPVVFFYQVASRL